MAEIQLRNLSKSWGNFVAVKDFNLTIADKEFLVLLGPSGCGKTTLLRIIAGLEEQSAGTVSIDNELVSGHLNHVNTEERNIGLVVQERALFPHLSIVNNVKYGIKGPNKNNTERAMSLLKLFSVERYAKNYPHEISSGEQQRVALARAMAPNPKILLMDEPFGALDKELKVRLRSETNKILRDNLTTTIIVSHDTEDALAMSDRVLIMKDGNFIQNGKPEDVISINSTASQKNLI